MTDKVRIVAADKKYQIAPVFACPTYDEVGKTFSVNGTVYQGKKTDPNEENSTVLAEKTPIRLTDHDSFRFVHLQEFNMESETDKFLLEILRGSGWLAKNKSAVNPIEHRFYLEDKEEEAKMAISKADLVYEAMSKIKAMTMDEMMDYSRLLGKNPKSLTKTQVEASLIEEAQKSPKVIINLTTDKNTAPKIFLRKLVDAKIVTIRNGQYYNGQEMIGINEDYAIQYLKDDVNNKVVTQWNQMITPTKKAQAKKAE